MLWTIAAFSGDGRVEIMHLEYTCTHVVMIQKKREISQPYITHYQHICKYKSISTETRASLIYIIHSKYKHDKQ